MSTISTGEILQADSILNHLSVGILWLDNKGNIAYCNETASHILQEKPPLLIGTSFHQFFDGVEVIDWNQYFTNKAPGEFIQKEFNIRTQKGDRIKLSVTFHKVNVGAMEYLSCLVKDTSTLEAHEMLRIISEGTASVVGGDFFRSLAYHIIVATGIRYAIITECANMAKTRVRTLVYIERENFLDNFEYDLTGTPCEIVMKGENYYCSADLDHFFSKEEGIKSYFGVPIFLSNGEIMGHIAIFDSKPLEISEQQLNILKIFASRAGAEIERKRKDELIQSSSAGYKILFNDSPVGLSEEDFSGVKTYLDKLAAKGITDLESYLTTYPDEIVNIHNQVKRTNVNRVMLSLFGFESVVDYLNSFAKFFQPNVFRQVLVAMHAGETYFEREVVLKNSSGENRYIIARRIIVPGFEKDWSKSIVSCIDVTSQKLAEMNLGKALGEVKQLKDRLEAENVYLQEEIKLDHNFDEIICQSEPFVKVLEKVQLVANTEATVLILGESGTGKELIARAIHSTSNRSKRPLVKINCAALPATLIESELFGHEKGAFTGALAQKIGRFELADGGTIFLDEVGELPLDLQAKLLRVIQEGEFERVGSSKTIRVDVRLIAATNRDLEQMIDEKLFRADLFYRLNVFPIISPPLRERKDDIPILVNHFCRKYGMKIGKKITSIPKKIMDTLMSYDWPGNVRELENVVERGIILSRSSVLELGDWLPEKHNVVQKEKLVHNDLMKLEDIERSHIISTLESKSWKVRGEDGAAKALGLNPTTLEARMKKLGIVRKK